MISCCSSTNSNLPCHDFDAIRKYTPPVPQGHVPGSSSIPMRGPDDQPPALRVSNIPLEAQQQDIEDVRTAHDAHL